LKKLKDISGKTMNTLNNSKIWRNYKGN